MYDFYLFLEFPAERIFHAAIEWVDLWPKVHGALFLVFTFIAVLRASMSHHPPGCEVAHRGPPDDIGDEVLIVVDETRCEIQPAEVCQYFEPDGIKIPSGEEARIVVRQNVA